MQLYLIVLLLIITLCGWSFIVYVFYKEYMEIKDHNEKQWKRISKAVKYYEENIRE